MVSIQLCLVLLAVAIQAQDEDPAVPDPAADRMGSGDRAIGPSGCDPGPTDGPGIDCAALLAVHTGQDAACLDPVFAQFCALTCCRLEYVPGEGGSAMGMGMGSKGGSSKSGGKSGSPPPNPAPNPPPNPAPNPPPNGKSGGGGKSSQLTADTSIVLQGKSGAALAASIATVFIAGMSLMAIRRSRKAAGYTEVAAMEGVTVPVPPTEDKPLLA